MKCITCGGKVKIRRDHHYHYTESGLNNVFLNGILIHNCVVPTCGEEAYEIPRIGELHSILAGTLATQEAKLSPEEIRFLRTHLGFSGVDFARHIGVTPKTVSCWENGKENMGATSERLLRVMIIANRKRFYDYAAMDAMATKEAQGAERMIVHAESGWEEEVA